MSPDPLAELVKSRPTAPRVNGTPPCCRRPFAASHPENARRPRLKAGASEVRGPRKILPAWISGHLSDAIQACPHVKH
jgi:hypothetical protein